MSHLQNSFHVNFSSSRLRICVSCLRKGTKSLGQFLLWLQPISAQVLRSTISEMLQCMQYNSSDFRGRSSSLCSSICSCKSWSLSCWFMATPICTSLSGPLPLSTQGCSVMFTRPDYTYCGGIASHTAILIQLHPYVHWDGVGTKCWAVSYARLTHREWGKTSLCGQWEKASGFRLQENYSQLLAWSIA